MKIDYDKLPRNEVCCVDMKSFYASIECAIRGLDPLETYLAVVGDLQRSGSVVLAASPKMKQVYNIKTGSRHFEIPREPHIHIVQARMGLYLKFSLKLTKLLHEFAPPECIHVYSVDESWISNGVASWYGSTWNMAEAIRSRIQLEMNLPSAIGIGPNKFIAKVILDIRAKKEGIASCTYEEFPMKVWPEPVENIWGIGPRLKVHLNRMGIWTLGDLARYPVERLKKRFGIMGEQLYYHAWGVDLSPVEVQAKVYEHKGFSSGITLLRDYHLSEIPRVLLDLLDEICARMRKTHVAARTVGVSCGYSKDTMTPGFQRTQTMESATNDPLRLHEVCLRLFRDETARLAVDLPVRRVHVSVSQLVPEDQMQYSLFDDVIALEKRQKAYAVMDTVRRKYGGRALFRASSLSSDSIALDRNTRTGGHFT